MMTSSSSRFFKYFLFLGQRGPSKVCSVGTRWMQNQIPHPTSSPDQNLSKNKGRYVENTNTKSSFFLFFLQNQLILFYYFPQEAHFELKFPLMCLINSSSLGGIHGKFEFFLYLYPHINFLCMVHMCFHSLEEFWGLKWAS